jgi:hypothetical protein
MDSDDGYGYSDEEMADYDGSEQPTSEDYGDFSGAEVISNLPKVGAVALRRPLAPRGAPGRAPIAARPRLGALAGSPPPR